MPVYVDTAIHPWRGRLWCHMWADGQAEMHAFAERLGIPRARFQRPPYASWRHYDLDTLQREAAIRLGAVPTDRYGALEHRARTEGDTALLERITRLRARSAASPVAP